ncbi:uncharacterized protein LOC120841703 [Ixodes scapularis]|uniref:Uncharacterized protein n=1 Tax=Ixodes scapularis TaxID=6945 RepID=B7QAX1_IXOSC|nr:uncharacterized protein LOC8038483 [Ixodes scapularis]XP_040068596.1 uncharacterized protein LOC120841703 [Ixodes scapularis]EEC15993.1 hypothetical protein IscW_ISCW012062 [Ixodes scapularis]|eukprot:XP_002412697.1 hypothetical protein IscW_ISCW012062 [Ixodes scapularis]
MVMAEGEASATKLTDSSFRKTLYALEQWPSAIESLRNENHSPQFVSTFCGLLDRTLSELEVISSLMDKQNKRQDGTESKSDEAPATCGKEDAKEDSASPAADPKPPVKKARMKYTPLRKLST